MRPQHITAENLGVPVPLDAAGGGFNEAAAYHCGKRHDHHESQSPDAASMRPQHITAENDRVDHPRAEGAEASMRPQHITAENPYRRPDPPGGYKLQ